MFIWYKQMELGMLYLSKQLEILKILKYYQNFVLYSMADFLSLRYLILWTFAALSSCSLNAAVTDMEAFRTVIPQEAQMKVLYDVYLPTATYKKSNPPSPNKRIVVMRYDIYLPGAVLHCLFHSHAWCSIFSILIIYICVFVFT